MRKDNGLICGPGGHIEAGEAPIQAAIREAQEEFGITPLSLSKLGTLGINVKSADAHCTEVFVCTEFSGRPKADNEEMCGALFVPRETLCEEFADSLFPPFKDSLLEFQKTELFVQLFDVEKSNNGDIIKLSEAQEDGGPGSGNFGHGGRPGKLGGSAPVSGSVGRMAQNKTWQKAKSAAEEKCKSVFPKNSECSEGTNYKGEKVGLAVQTKEAQQFYNDVSSGKLKSIEELKNDPVVQQLDSISQECTKALGGETILDESPERQQLREEIKTEFLNNGSARLDDDGNYVYDGEIKKEHNYHTDWMSEDELHLSIDGLNMDAVYESLVRQIAGDKLQTDSGESLKESVERDEKKKQLEKQIAALENKMRREKQLNRRMEMNAELKKLRKNWR